MFGRVPAPCRHFFEFSVSVEILCYALCEARFVWFRPLSGSLVVSRTPVGRDLALPLLPGFFSWLFSSLLRPVRVPFDSPFQVVLWSIGQVTKVIPESFRRA